MMFCGSEKEVQYEFEECAKVYRTYDIKLQDGSFVVAKDILVGMVLDGMCVVTRVETDGNYMLIYCKEQ